MIVGLQKVNDKNRFGEKACNLSSVMKDFDVADGFVLSRKMFEEFIRPIKDKGLAGNEARTVVYGTTVPEEIKSLVKKHYEYLVNDSDIPDKAMELISAGRDRPVVSVRSSIIPYRKSAGETFLNVHSNKIMDSIKKCWASFFCDRARLLGNFTGMGVIIQKMMDCEIAGNILTNTSMGTVIEAAYGMGNMLNNNIDCDRYVINDKVEKYIGNKANKETKQGVVSVEKEKRNKAVLSNDMLYKLNNIVEKLTQKFQENLFVEFGIVRGKIFLFQVNELDWSERDVDDGGYGNKVSEGLQVSPGRIKGKVVGRWDGSEDSVLASEHVGWNTLKDVQGLITSKGNFSSRLACICRALEIPYIVADYKGLEGKRIVVENGNIYTQDITMEKPNTSTRIYALIDEYEERIEGHGFFIQNKGPGLVRRVAERYSRPILYSSDIYDLTSTDKIKNVGKDCKIVRTPGEVVGLDGKEWEYVLFDMGSLNRLMMDKDTKDISENTTKYLRPFVKGLQENSVNSVAINFVPTKYNVKRLVELGLDIVVDSKDVKKVEGMIMEREKQMMLDLRREQLFG